MVDCGFWNVHPSEGNAMGRADIDQLVTENIRLAYYVANKYRNTKLDYDDVLSSCFFGLTKAAKDFDSTKSKFSTYAVLVMHNEVRMLFRYIKRRSLNVSYEEHNYEIYSSNDYKVIEDSDYIADLLNCLTEKEKSVVIQIYGIGIEKVKQSDISIQLNVKQPQISRIKTIALNKMRAVAEGW